MFSLLVWKLFLIYLSICFFTGLGLDQYKRYDAKVSWGSLLSNCTKSLKAVIHNYSHFRHHHHHHQFHLLIETHTFFYLGTSSLFLCTRVSMFSGSWHSRFALFSLIFFILFFTFYFHKKISKQLNTIFSRFCKQVFCSLLLPAPPQSPPKFCIVLTLSLSSCSILMICPLLISFLFWSIFSSR